MSTNDKSKVAKDNQSMELPAGMFRSGQKVEGITMQMHRRNYGLVNVQAKYSEVDGSALFEGDIVLGEAKEVRGEADPRFRGIGLVGQEFRWPNGTVPYVTEEALRPLVEAAIAHWQENTPFIFVPRTSESDYLSFEQLSGCWSMVGKRGGEQTISLGLGCGLGAAIHEIGHALGLWHEQSREDRDQFIEIIWENIVDSHKHNFDKHVLDGDDLGSYDHGSIMHYPATAFSKNGLPTIRAIGGEPIGQRTGLSTSDVAAIQMMYPDLSWPQPQQ